MFSYFSVCQQRTGVLEERHGRLVKAPGRTCRVLLRRPQIIPYWGVLQSFPAVHQQLQESSDWQRQEEGTRKDCRAEETAERDGAGQEKIRIIPRWGTRDGLIRCQLRPQSCSPPQRPWELRLTPARYLLIIYTVHSTTLHTNHSSALLKSISLLHEHQCRTLNNQRDKLLEFFKVTAVS